MPNGKPYDHPLTDILVHGVETYGQEADDLIRKISDLTSRSELNDWWETEIGWAGGRELALQKAKLYHDGLVQCAKDRGWELT